MNSLRQRAKPQRRLATVLFTDIVRSTELLSEIGDKQWRDLIAEHHAIVRRALKRHGGRELDTAGDGFLAEFPRPLPAIECALSVVQELKEYGIEIRSGIHMGEVEVIGPKLGGMAVHIGARIAAKAEAGEVLVSGTVRDLVAGADLLFTDRGEHELKGVPGAWRIFAVRPRVQVAPRQRPAGGPPASAAGRPLNSRRLALGAVAALLVLGGGAFAASRVLGGGGAPAVVGAQEVGRIDASTGRVLLAGHVGSKPAAIASGGGYLWVVDAADQTLAQVDPQTAAVVGSRSVNGAPAGVAYGAGLVWVSVNFGVGQPGSLVKFRPGGSGTEAVIPLGSGNGWGATAFGFQSVWVANFLDGTLTRVDPDTGGVLATIPVGKDPEAVTVYGNSVWVADSLDKLVLRIDPATNRVTARVTLLAAPSGITGGAGAIWCVSSSANQLLRVDTAANRQAATIALPPGPSAVAFASGAVWVALATAREVVKVDPGSGRVSGSPIALSGSPAALYGDGEALWVAAQ